MFKDRLKSYRYDLQLNVAKMAEKLNISSSYYSLLESNKRQPSKSLIDKLVSISQKPEEYWYFGMNINEYNNNLDDFKSLRKAATGILALDILKNEADVNNLFDDSNTPQDSLGKLLVNALKSDMIYMVNKKH